MSAVADRPRFYTPAQLADELQVTERHIRNLISKREIPSYKVGRARRISAADVDRYLEQIRQFSSTSSRRCT